MGALTLKNFPFELRGWDIEKFKSIDPTDGFGSSIKVYISKNQVIQIEPNYDSNSYINWITDKGRQYFDGIFGTFYQKKQINEEKCLKSSWNDTFDAILKAIYLFDHCKNRLSKNHFFLIIFENVNVELISLLLLISQNYSFLKLRRAESIKAPNDFEANFQLNSPTNKVKLQYSTLCILIAVNSRYEGYLLNLNLRQRFLKGNFTCLSIGSVINLTFPISFLGSNLKILKNICEGNNLICQDLKFAKNPFLIFNHNLLKRKDGVDVLSMIQILKYGNLFTKTWNGINLLNPSLSDTGIQTLAKFERLSEQDIQNFSILYFLNISENNIKSLKKITEAKLLSFSAYILSLNFLWFSNLNLPINKICINNNSETKISLIDKNNAFHYYKIPSSVFFENEETFINTEGFIKRTNKLIFRKKTRTNWQILRKLTKHFKTQVNSVNEKNNQIIFFNLQKISYFKNFINFHYYATRSLNNLNFYLNIKNKPFILYNYNCKFKKEKIKILNTKLKYWLDDFFIGGKDEYTSNSLVMSNCSRILRLNSSNFL